MTHEKGLVMATPEGTVQRKRKARYFVISTDCVYPIAVKCSNLVSCEQGLWGESSINIIERSSRM
jgi:hypothetical protein